MKFRLSNLLLFSSGVTSVYAGGELPDQRPNIVIILADDLGWTDLACTGSDFYETPHIDKLRDSGMLFTQAYSNAANSAPSRACLMTGLYSPRHGIYTVNPPDRGEAKDRKLIPYANNHELPTSYTLLPRFLKEQGYYTIHIGKWHLGNDERGTGPLSHGFDINKGGGDEGSPYSYFFPYCSQTGKCLTGLEQGEENEYLTDRLTEEAIKHIRQTNNKPFFLYLAHHAVHTPLQAKEELIEKYKRKPAGSKHSNPTYAAMIESLDESVGKVIGALEETGKIDNTIIIFLSDNGGMLNGISDNTPLRGGKGNPYEGGNRIPMIIQWKGKISPATTCDIPVIGMDLFPTIADLTGTTPAIPLDGTSLKPLLMSTESLLPNRSLYFSFPAYLQNYGKLEGFRATPYNSIISGEWKLIRFFETNTTELYNLKNDIGETTDLTDIYPGKSLELLKQLNEWEKSVNAPVHFEKNPLYQD